MSQQNSQPSEQQPAVDHAANMKELVSELVKLSQHHNKQVGIRTNKIGRRKHLHMAKVAMAGAQMINAFISTVEKGQEAMKQEAMKEKADG